MATQFYRKVNPRTGVKDFFEQGTNRYIGPNEFGQGAGFQEVQEVNQSQDQPTIRRDESGAIEKLVTSPIDGIKSKVSFLQAAKDIIKRKQSISQPLTAQKAYWRGLQQDTSPFGGARDQHYQRLVCLRTKTLDY